MLDVTRTLSALLCCFGRRVISGVITNALSRSSSSNGTLRLPRPCRLVACNRRTAAEAKKEGVRAIIRQMQVGLYTVVSTFPQHSSVERAVLQLLCFLFVVQQQ